MQAKKYTEKAEKLKSEVQIIIDTTKHQRDQLELIDNLQRLDISNHFEDGVQKLLQSIYLTVQCHDKQMDQDLYVTALKFRLLRQHGYCVPQGHNLLIRFKPNG